MDIISQIDIFTLFDALNILDVKFPVPLGPFWVNLDVTGVQLGTNERNIAGYTGQRLISPSFGSCHFPICWWSCK
jgi:hypothetical protein